MAPAWLLLIALACSALAQVSADCGKCATEECVSGGEGWARFKKCVCVPSLENCQGGTPITNISTQIQKAERCIDSVYSCALDEIKGYLPNLDTQICDTAESQRKFEEGDWKAYYGPRVWDSEALGTIIGLFFPATSALAAAKLVRVACAYALRAIIRQTCSCSATAFGRTMSSTSKSRAWNSPLTLHWRMRRTRCALERWELSLLVPLALSAPCSLLPAPLGTLCTRFAQRARHTPASLQTGRNALASHFSVACTTGSCPAYLRM